MARKKTLFAKMETGATLKWFRGGGIVESALFSADSAEKAPKINGTKPLPLKKILLPSHSFLIYCNPPPSPPRRCSRRPNSCPKSRNKEKL